MLYRGHASGVRVEGNWKEQFQFSSNFRRGLGLLLFAMFLIPSSLWANTSKNCPTEPGHAAIVSGETYFGTKCVLNTASDLDTFTFNASVGDTWKMVAGTTNAEYPNNVCMNLNDPNGNLVIWTCSDSAANNFAAVLIPKLTLAGVYTIVVYETKNASIDYGISLERISPAPADGTALTLGTVVSGAITPPSAQHAYTVYGTTTGTYEVSATMTSGAYPQNLCFSVYQPGGTAVVGFQCTDTAANEFTAQAEFTPTADGTYVVIAYSAVDNDPLNSTLSVACAGGICGKPTTTCSLKDALTYNATTGTLTMDFTLGTPYAVTWNAWVTSENSMQSLWSVSQPITEPPTTVTMTQTLSKSGKVGVLSTLTTPTKGITCSSWAMINTGTP